MILIIGLPNAGKTTYSIQFENVIHFDNIPHTNNEEWYNKCDELAKKSSDDIIIEGIYNNRNRRIKLLEACKDKSIKKNVYGLILM